MSQKKCIIRLLRYKNALHRLSDLGFVRVFSDNLADAVGGTATQVRKDFSLFGISGNKRGGYQIALLLEKLNHLLGKGELQKVVVVGAGNIGTALLKYKGFEKDGIRIAACFDIDPSKFSKAADKDVPILALEGFRDFVKQQKIKIGIIAVPEIAAQQVFDMMYTSGVKGVLNFAPIRLKVPADCVINNVNLVLELETVISFLINGMGKVTGEIHGDEKP
jgi:redox-sensing transcriptional repressor